MADKNYTIRISTVADNTGSDSAKEGLDQLDPVIAGLNEKQKQAGKSADEMSLSHRQMHAAARALGPQFAGLGHAILSGFTDPTLAGLLLLGLALEGFKKLCESMIPIMPVFGQSLAPSVAAARDRFIEAAEAMSKFQVAMTAAVTAETFLASSQKIREEGIRSATAAQVEQTAAIEKAGRASLALALAEGKITQAQYDVQAAALASGSAADALAAKQRGREAIVAEKGRQAGEAQRGSQQAAGEYTTAKTASDAAAELAAENKEKIGILRENIKKQKDAMNQLNTGPGDFWSGVGTQAEMREFLSYKEKIARDQKKLDDRIARQVELNDQAAKLTAETNQKQQTATELKKKAEALNLESNELFAAHNQALKQEADLQKINRLAAARELGAKLEKTPEGADVARAAELIKRGQTPGHGLRGLSPEDQQFLLDINQRFTGAGTQTGGLPGLRQAAANFGGAAPGTEKFGDIYQRLGDIGQVRHDEATAQALQAGRGVDAASQQQMVEHAKMLTGVTQTVASAARVMAHVADKIGTLDAAVKALEAKLANTHN
jgi:hypothetical protein